MTDNMVKINYVAMMSVGFTFDQMKEVMKMECQRRNHRPHMLKCIRSLVPALRSWVCVQIATGESREEVRYFTVKATVKLEPLLKRFMRLKRTKYTFVLYGQSVSEDDTPYSLRMNDNDRICAHQYR